MNIILSIHPKWAKLIYEGKKTVEWRKTYPKADVSIVFIYETAPVCKVTVFFHLNGAIAADSKNCSMSLFRWEDGCVSLEDLQRYQGKNKRIFGLIVTEPRRANCPMPIADFGLERPPQSWCYTEVDV